MRAMQRTAPGSSVCREAGHRSLRPSGHRHLASPQHRCRHTALQASFLDTIGSLFSPSKQQQKRPQRPALVEDVLQAIREEKPDKAAIVQLVKDLQAQQEGDVTTDAKLLSATWRLLWTTEKETEFIVKNAGVFGTEAGDIYQIIDVDAGTLQNVITFPPEGAFVVNSDIQVEGDQRVAFKFNSAELRLPNDKSFKLPPFGQGWFDNIYVDDEIRIARDIRQDVLVVARDGPPQVY